MDQFKLGLHIKKLAAALGFQDVAFAAADELTDEARYLEAWLKQGFHGSLHYMERHFDLRIDPRKLVPGAKTVICLSYNYYTPVQRKETDPKISIYASGEDYHLVIREKLNLLMDQIKSVTGDIQARGFTDSAPVLEKAWAAKSGLGWIGKNTNLLTKRKGSFFFLAEIITDLELIPDILVKNYCGSCNKCIEACPTQAFIAPYQLDASKCISYATIEWKDETLPAFFEQQMQNWIFGCDVCQQVCPINGTAEPHSEPRFGLNRNIHQLNWADWEQMDEESFRNQFRKSPLWRTGFKGIQRNLHFVKNNGS